MVKKKGIMMAACLTMALAACDDGRLYEKPTILPEEGRVVKLTGNLSGIGEWSNGYNVVVAGFTDDSEYAIISKSVQTGTNGKAEVVLSGIKENVQRVELCVINRLRKRILTLRTADLNMTDTIRLEVGTMNVGMYTAIQEQLFNTTCTSCHGASTFAGAGLYLTEGKSYDALVGVPSRLVSDKLLVEPGNADASVLYQTVATRVSTTWRQDHSNMVMNATMRDVVKDWINNVVTSESATSHE